MDFLKEDVLMFKLKLHTKFIIQFTQVYSIRYSFIYSIMNRICSFTFLFQLDCCQRTKWVILFIKLSWITDKNPLIENRYFHYHCNQTVYKNCCLIFLAGYCYCFYGIQKMILIGGGNCCTGSVDRNVYSVL